MESEKENNPKKNISISMLLASIIFPIIASAIYSFTKATKKQKTQSWACSIFVFAFLIIADKLQSRSILEASKLIVFTLIAISIVLAGIYFSKLVFKSIRGITWATRLLVVLSVLYILGCAISIEPWYKPYYDYDYLDDFILVGLVPIVILWGIVWVGSAVNKN